MNRVTYEPAVGAKFLYYEGFARRGITENVMILGTAQELAKAAITSNFECTRWRIVDEHGLLLKAMYTTYGDAHAAALLYYTSVLRRY